MKMAGKTSVWILIFLSCLKLAAIEVGGEITQNTTWNPQNNPYIVIHDIIVDSGVELTILPGTVIQFHAMPVIYENIWDDFYVHNGNSNAKMMYVDGRIIALGTEQDSITFTRYEQSPDNMRWGNIVFRIGAPKSIFRHCKLMYGFTSSPEGAGFDEGTLCCQNGKLDIAYCRFLDNMTAIWMEEIHEPILVSHIVYQQFHSYPDGWCPTGFWNASENYGAEVVLAYNQHWGFGGTNFYTPPVPQSYPSTQLFNEIHLNMTYNQRDDRTANEGDVYGNILIGNQSSGLSGYSVGNNVKAYIRRNTFVGTGGIYAFGNVDISDNDLTNANCIEVAPNSNVDIYNNHLKNTIIEHNGAGKIYNNVINDFGPRSAYNINPGVYKLSNNIACNGYGFPVVFDGNPINTCIENCIFWATQSYNNYPYSFANTTFRNNCMSIPLPNQCINGGGNIIGSNPMFADSLNGDFHLLAGSPCIDAGFDSTGYALFDNDYYHRVVDGDNNGSSVIDIGAYEYGSSYAGGFEGHIYLEENVPLALAKVDIEGAITSREYTDSTGFFRFSVPAGTYTLNVHHIFEGDSTFEVEINEGQTTTHDFYYNPIGTEDNVVPAMGYNLHNYPNPFNPETAISYILRQKGTVSLNIYNLKGQKIKTIINKLQAKGEQVTYWDGRDDNGKDCSTGIYIVKLMLDGKPVSSKKVTLVK